jgi:truncated hemoglobin YjbI
MEHALPAPHWGEDLMSQPGETDLSATFGGFAFAGGAPPDGAGLYVLARRIGSTLHPVLIGESETIAATLQDLRTDPALARGLADSAFSMLRANARQRRHILRDLVGRCNPPLNVADRTARSAPEIAALVPDRAEDVFPAEAPAEPVEASEDDLDRLVRVFYGKAREDDVIGPIFRSHVSDWEHHFALVQAFWSRALRGTDRYKGGPFAPHLGLNLKPEHFARWVVLFRETAEAVLKPAAARDAFRRVEHMSAAFQAGLFPLDGERAK